MESSNAKHACLFLADYAALLYGCGATCARIKKNVDRIVSVWNLNLELMIMPGSIHLTHFDEVSGLSQAYIKKAPHMGISFYKNTQLSKLSWSIADRMVTQEEAKREFGRIISAPNTNGRLVLLLTSLANMSFCRLFGGDACAMATVFLATLAGFRFKQMLLDEHIDTKAVFVLCAFFSSVIGSAGYVFHFGDTPDVSLGTSVLYLIPGIPYINSISDMIQGQYLVSFCRFMDAVTLTFCLSVGLAAGILLMNLRMF